jgi:hypothetical protein
MWQFFRSPMKRVTECASASQLVLETNATHRALSMKYEASSTGISAAGFVSFEFGSDGVLLTHWHDGGA